MSLNKGGKFIFDCGGAADGFGTYMMDEVICKYEAYLMVPLVRLLRKKNCVVTKKHHGYRSRNQEIVSVAESNGFKLIDIRCSEPIAEIERSFLLRGLAKKCSPLRYLIHKIGSTMPYVRMFAFELE